MGPQETPALQATNRLIKNKINESEPMQYTDRAWLCAGCYRGPREATQEGLRPPKPSLPCLARPPRTGTSD